MTHELNAPGLNAPQEALHDEGPNFQSPNILEPLGEQSSNSLLTELLATLSSLPRYFISPVLALSKLTRTFPAEEKASNQTSRMPMSEGFEEILQMRAISATTSGPDPSSSQEFLAKLQQQARMEAVPIRDLAPVQAQVFERPQDRASHMTLLHKVLSEYITCPMDTCVRLNDIEKSAQDDIVKIGMLLTNHPHERITKEQENIHWLDTQIGISTTAITFQGHDAGHEGGEFEEVNRQLDHQHALCSAIASYLPQTSMSLLVRKSRKESKLGYKLMIGTFAQPTTKLWETKHPSTSLFDLLKGTVGTSPLSYPMKHSLSIILAKAVWECYKTPWMRKPWTCHEVHFVLETRMEEIWGNEPGLFVDEPLLASSLTSSHLETLHSETLSEIPPKRPIHQIPNILALGIMLMEIWLGHPIEDEVDTNRKHPKTNGEKHMHCLRIISRDKERFHALQIPPNLQPLVTSCIVDWRSEFLTSGNKTSDDEIRNRLGILVSKAMYCLNDISKPVPIRIHRSGSDPTDQPIGNPARFLEQGRPVPRHDSVISDIQRDGGNTMNRQTSGVSSDEWFSKTAKIIDILKDPSEKPGSYQKVKVAVLDTGILQGDSKRIPVPYKDFVGKTGNGTTRATDKSGHGTTSIRLILTMCDSAEVFALRVFENDTAGSEAVDSVVKALNWCIEEDIEIVCMALGFESDETHRLLDIVKKASEKMLIIAAPTNKGNLDNISIPALYNKYVLPIYSSNGYVIGSDFNPSTKPGRKLAMLGEDISAIEVGPENTYGPQHSSVAKSGTSYSTALAVGFAARLVEFAGHSDVESILHPQAQKLMIDKSIMKDVLCKLADEEKDTSFFFIKPWELLEGKGIMQGELDKAKKLCARQSIAWKIQHILERCRLGVDD